MLYLSKTLRVLWPETHPGFLMSQEDSMQGLLLRQAGSSAQWNDFIIHVSEAFRKKFGEAVEYRRDAHFGVGIKLR
jgi:hypothetical protein